jgi:tryptophan synthase alpha chain
MNRLSAAFGRLRAGNKKALSLFLTAGYPSIELTVPLVLAMERAGADIVELGVPFSDPIADGPTIQMSSDTALRNGVTLSRCFALVRAIRRDSNIPIVLMGYLNPLFSFGLEKFFSECSSAGVDGSIVPDLPIEESHYYRDCASAAGVATIFLAAPTTTGDRLRQVDEQSSGFIYCVSVTGVTGERVNLAAQARDFLVRARETVRNNPLMVGFGITTPADARSISRFADGVIVGSALIQAIRGDSDTLGAAASFVSSMREALDAP